MIDFDFSLSPNQTLLSRSMTLIIRNDFGGSVDGEGGRGVG